MQKILPAFLFLLAVPFQAHAEVKITQSISYGHNRAEIVDIYQPDTCRKANCPVTMWVHGGGWRHGNMQGERASEMMTTWAKQGIVMVGVNYRLAPEYMHPAQIEDVAAAINWVCHNISDYGGDPHRISLLGHSAGAHLVALVATNPTYLGAYGLSPGKVLSNVFPIDTASFDLTNPSRLVSRMIREAFGTNRQTLEEASPIWNVHRGGSYPPFIMAATKVRNDAVQTSQILQQKLRDAGASADLMIIDYPGLRQLKAHAKIASDLANLDSNMTKVLLARVLGQP
jgi:arylformamidase